MNSKKKRFKIKIELHTWFCNPIKRMPMVSFGFETIFTIVKLLANSAFKSRTSNWVHLTSMASIKKKKKKKTFKKFFLDKASIISTNIFFHPIFLLITTRMSHHIYYGCDLGFVIPMPSLTICKAASIDN